MRVVPGVAALLLLGSVVLTLTRFLTVDQRYPAAAAAVSPYAVLGFVLVLLGVGLALLRGRRGRTVLLLGTVAAVGVVAHVAWLAPRFVADDRPGTGSARLRVLTANLEFSQADPDSVVAAVRDNEVDVAVLEEVRPYGLELLERAGLRRVLPDVVGRPTSTASGTMVFSRLPLASPAPVPLGNGGLSVTVGDADSPVGPVRLVAAHTAQPLSGARVWAADLATLRRSAAEAVATGPTVVAGDLNATLDHRLLRQVLGSGLSDAAGAAGSGWQPTWPNRYRFSWTRPVVAIDHVLTSRQLTAVRTSTVELPGSDHLGLLAVLAPV